MLKKSCLTAVFLLLVSVGCFGQTETAGRNNKPATAAALAFRASPAYAELLLKRTEMTAELEALVLEYTEEYPRVKDIRHAITLLDRESARLANVKAADQGRLTLALGKLMVRKIELEIELWNLQKNYKDEHPDVKRAKRRVEIYETAIGEVLN
jgi:hypothetical protein